MAARGVYFLKLSKLQSTNFFKCPREEVPNGVFGPAGWNLQLHLGLFDPQHLVVQMGIVQPNVCVVQTTHNFRVKSRVALPSFSHLFLSNGFKKILLGDSLCSTSSASVSPHFQIRMAREP